MQKVLDGMVDFGKAFIIGIISGAAIEVSAVLIGLIVYKGYWANAFLVGRNTVIFIGAVGLLVSSGLFIKKSGLRPLKDQAGWKRNFKVLNFGYVLMALFIGIIITGGILDLFIYKFTFK